MILGNNSMDLSVMNIVEEEEVFLNPPRVTGVLNSKLTKTS